MPLPLKLFEVSDVVYRDDKVERRARNERRVCGLFCGKVSGFEVRFEPFVIGSMWICSRELIVAIQLIHGLLDRLMAMLNVPSVSVGNKNGYYIQESERTDLR